MAMDENMDFRLSGGAGKRGVSHSWCNEEAEKLSMLFAYAARFLKRDGISRSVAVNRLKLAWQEVAPMPLNALMDGTVEAFTASDVGEEGDEAANEADKAGEVVTVNSSQETLSGASCSTALVAALADLPQWSTIVENEDPCDPN